MLTMSDMADRIRLIIDTSEPVRRAVRVAAAKRGLSPSDLVNEILQRELASEIDAMAEYVTPPTAPDSSVAPKGKRKPSAN